MSGVLLVAAVVASVLNVTDDWNGTDVSKSLSRATNGYGEGAEQVSFGAIADLRAVLIQSDHPMDAAALGITRKNVDTFRAEIAADAQLTPVQAAKLDVARIAHVLEMGLRVFGDNDGETKVLLDVHLDDGHDLAVSSASPSILPWHVTVGGRSWTSFDPAIAKAVVAVLGSASPNRRRLLERNAWVSSDPPWSFWFLAADACDLGLAHVQTLPGFEAASKDWFVRAMDYQGALSVTLEPRRPGVVGEIQWTVDTAHPSFDVILRRVEQVQSRLLRSAWFVRAQAHPQLVAHVRFGGESNDLWRDAALRGAPDMTLDVFVEGVIRQGIIAGRDDDRLVVAGGLKAFGVDDVTDVRGSYPYATADISGTLTKRALTPHAAPAPTLH